MNKPLYFTRVVNAFLTEDRTSTDKANDDTFNSVLAAFQNEYNSIATFQ